LAAIPGRGEAHALGAVVYGDEEVGEYVDKHDEWLGATRDWTFDDVRSLLYEEASDSALMGGGLMPRRWVVPVRGSRRSHRRLLVRLRASLRRGGLGRRHARETRRRLTGCGWGAPCACLAGREGARCRRPGGWRTLSARTGLQRRSSGRHSGLARSADHLAPDMAPVHVRAVRINHLI
jgi:hypothetical protein